MTALPPVQGFRALPHRGNLAKLATDLAKVRKSGFALNQERSERGIVAVGVPVQGDDGSAVAGLSVSMPSVRYDRHRLPELVETLKRAAAGIEPPGAS